MPFAIKLELKPFDLTTELNSVRYYCQTLETLNDGVGLTEMVILTDGKDPEEVDVSSTLVEAEKKLERLTANKKYKNILSLKIVEFPEKLDQDKK